MKTSNATFAQPGAVTGGLTRPGGDPLAALRNTDPSGQTDTVAHRTAEVCGAPAPGRLGVLGFLAGLVALVTAGCATFAPADQVRGPSYRPGNYFNAAARWPLHWKRVAVLPLAETAANDPELDGRRQLEPVLLTELAKLQRFEVQVVSATDLRRWTGRETWRASDELPQDFFARLRQATGCDAVLFCELTRFEPYPPLVVGWRLTLVEGERGQVWWAVDEVFDASEPAVANGARRYQLARAQGTPPTGDSRGILHSPRRFGHYATSALLGTMPER